MSCASWLASGIKESGDGAVKLKIQLLRLILLRLPLLDSTCSVASDSDMMCPVLNAPSSSNNTYIQISVLAVLGG